MHDRMVAVVTNTKAMKNKKIRRFIPNFGHTSLLALSSAVLIGATFIPVFTHIVQADSFQDQINSLNSQNSDVRNTVGGLQTQAASYQDAINQLQQQIDGLQSSIDANTIQQEALQQQMDAARVKLDQQKAFLASDVKAMYVDGTPTTLEVLATSKNLSDFVDKQQYRASVQGKLQDTLATISKLQNELKNKKTQVDQLLTTQKSQQDQLAGARTQQASMLSYNQSQQNTYNAQISANSKQISSLRAQQAAANSKLGSGITAGDSGHGGYPNKWDNVGMDSTLDSWGMYNRECVSYTAWKVYSTYGYMPYWGGNGNANQWPDDARRAGIKVSSTPKAQTVAIWDTGHFGHAMWVEAVNSDGSLWVSQYNYDWTGHYSEMYVKPNMASNLQYIYFGG